MDKTAEQERAEKMGLSLDIEDAFIIRPATDRWGCRAWKWESCCLSDVQIFLDAFEKGTRAFELSLKAWIKDKDAKCR